MLQDPAQTGRGWALTQVTRGAARPARAAAESNRFFGYSLRTSRWRYTEWQEGEKGRELYDHDVDPLEQTNLASLPEHQTTVNELSGILRDATAKSFPASGKTPEVQSGLWAPLLVAP